MNDTVVLWLYMPIHPGSNSKISVWKTQTTTTLAPWRIFIRLLIISVHSRFVDGKYRDKCINTQPHDTFLHLDYGERHRYHRSFCFSSLVFANHASVSQVSVRSHRMPPTSCSDSSSVAQQENRYSERCPIELHFVEHHRGWQTRRTFTNPVSIKICCLLRVG